MIISKLDTVKRFMHNIKGTASSGFITIIVFIFIWLACLPIVVTQVQTLYTGGWNFTGGSGASTLLGLVPFLYVIAGVIAVVAFALKGRGTE